MKYYSSLIVLIAFIFSFHICGAQNIWSQIGDDIDGEDSYDNSGFSVSMDSTGNYLAVGAMGNDGNGGSGSKAGHVRVYKKVSGNWQQIGNDINGATGDDYFGRRVSLSSDGTILAVSALKTDVLFTYPGYVKVFGYIGGNWVQLGNTLYGETSSDNFGISLSLSFDGTTLAVGASYNSGNGSNAGHVRVYKYNGSSWIQIGTDIDGENPEERSGKSVSLSADGTTLVVGAPTYSFVGNQWAGCVRVYEYNGSNWIKKGIDICGITAYDSFGKSVSINSDGSIIAVGADSDISGSSSTIGRVRVYEYNGSTWIPKGSVIFGENDWDYSGNSVDLSYDGNILAIGAPYNDDAGSDAGHVRVYGYNGSNWIQKGVDINGENPGDLSGYSVCLNSDGSRVAIGAINNNGNGTEAGHVRAFDFCGTTSTINVSGCSYTSPSGNHIWTQSDTYIDTIQNTQGCDSVITINYTSNNSTSTVTLSGCSYTTASGIVYLNSGVYLDTILNSSGCDSIMTINFNSNSSTSSITETVLCSYTSPSGSIFTQSGIYYDTIPNSVGCDSIITINLTISNPTSTISETDTCTYTSPSGNIWTNSGTYTDTIPSVLGCDSIITIYLTIIENYTYSTLEIDTCTNYTAPSGNIYTSSGSYTDVIPNAAGCDSLIFIDLTITQWEQVGSDIYGEDSDDHFGYSVCISGDGNVMAVGTPYYDGNGSIAGQVRIYEYIGGSWQQKGNSINAEADSDFFGCSVSLSDDGSVVAIGAPLNDANTGNTNDDRGHVRVYRYDNGSWGQIGNDIDGESYDDESGRSVSLSADGNIVAIGAIYNNGNGSNSGHVRIYELNGGNWIQKGGDIDGEFYDDESGHSVSLSSDGNIVAVGAPQNDANGYASGHVRVFEYLGGSWIQIGSDIDGQDQSGWSVSLNSDGSILAVASRYGYGNSPGYANIYINSAGNWVQMGNSITGDTEKCSVSLSSDGYTLAVGSPGSLYSTNPSSSNVKVYKYKAGNWYQIIDQLDFEDGNGFGSGFSLGLSSDGTRIVIGAPGANTSGLDAGRARVYEYSGNFNEITEVACYSYTSPSGNVYMNSGTYLDMYPSSNSCDSLLTINLTINTESYSTISEVVTCSYTSPSGNYTWTQSGTFMDTIPNIAGCDSIITIDLTVSQWVQMGNDIDGEIAGDLSGTSVSLSADGHVVAVGAPENDGSGNIAGHVRVFESISGVWMQVGQGIDGEAAGDGSGWSVSLSFDGNIVAIGAPGNDGNGNVAGHVRVFSFNGTDWIQIGQDIDGDESYDNSGWSVSLNSSGNILAIGSPHSDVNGNNSGKVKVFLFNGTDWIQLGNDIIGAASNYDFGHCVSLSSDGYTLAATGTDGYSTRVYEYNGSNWLQKGNEIAGASALSLNSYGNILAYGNMNYQNGKVRVYEFVSGSWIQMGSDIDGEALGDRLGNSICLNSDGTILAIGAKFNDSNGNNSGYVRIYDFINGNWQQRMSDIEGEQYGDESGTSVSLNSNGNIVAIGAKYNDGNGTNSGHVRIYENNVSLLDTINELACDYYISPSGNIYYSSCTIIDTLLCDIGWYFPQFINLTITTVDTTIVVLGDTLFAVSNADSYQWIDCNNSYLPIAGATGQSFTPDHNGSYAVIVTQNGCVDTSACYQMTHLPEDLISGLGVLIYPNPTTGELTIEGKGIEQIEIMNVNGQVILRQFVTNERFRNIIDLSDKSKGIYFIKVTTTKGVAVEKVVLE